MSCIYVKPGWGAKATPLLLFFFLEDTSVTLPALGFLDKVAEPGAGAWDKSLILTRLFFHVSPASPGCKTAYSELGHGINSLALTRLLLCTVRFWCFRFGNGQYSKSSGM